MGKRRRTQGSLGFEKGLKFGKKLSEGQIKRARVIRKSGEFAGFKVAGKKIAFSDTREQSPKRAGFIQGVIRSIEKKKGKKFLK